MNLFNKSNKNLEIEQQKKLKRDLALAQSTRGLASTILNGTSSTNISSPPGSSGSSWTLTSAGAISMKYPSTTPLISPLETELKDMRLAMNKLIMMVENLTSDRQKELDEIRELIKE